MWARYTERWGVLWLRYVIAARHFGIESPWRTATSRCTLAYAAVAMRGFRFSDTTAALAIVNDHRFGFVLHQRRGKRRYLTARFGFNAAFLVFESLLGEFILRNVHLLQCGRMRIAVETEIGLVLDLMPACGRTGILAATAPGRRRCAFDLLWVTRWVEFALWRNRALEVSGFDVFERISRLAWHHHYRGEKG